MRISYKGIISDFQSDDVGSIPSIRSNFDEDFQLIYYRYTLDDLQKSSDRKLFTYISFFAGGGGSSAGYKLAGGDCLFVNEFQQVAVDTYLANWPDTPHICGDIKKVTGQQIWK